jgi:ribosome-binding factor A
MTKSYKIPRLEKELYRLVSAVFQGDISDPRLLGLEITRIQITKDLSILKIYFSKFDKELTLENIMELLQKSSGFIKKQIAGASIMRTIPNIVFQYDKSTERTERIDQIFQQISSEKRNNDYYDDDTDNEYYNDDEVDDDDFTEYGDYNEELDESIDDINEDED